MMSNLYPFLVSKTAIKHEKIENFKTVPEPENHILIAHCCYLGVIPRLFTKDWILRPKVLEIVEDNAIAIGVK